MNNMLTADRQAPAGTRIRKNDTPFVAVVADFAADHLFPLGKRRQNDGFESEPIPTHSPQLTIRYFDCMLPSTNLAPLYQFHPLMQG